MSWLADIATLRRDIVTMLDTRLGMLFGWTLTAKTSSMGDSDQVQSDDENQGQRPVRRIEPWGVRGRPAEKVRSFWIRLGSSNVVFLGIAPTKSYGPSDLDVGETAIYSSADGAKILVDKDGKITVLASSGKIVALNGEDYSLPKWDDAIGDIGTFTSTIALLTPATVPTLVDTVNAIITAATTFETARATASNYKSTKVKNG